MIIVDWIALVVFSVSNLNHEARRHSSARVDLHRNMNANMQTRCRESVVIHASYNRKLWLARSGGDPVRVYPVNVNNSSEYLCNMLRCV
jgi:hypothetical protein